MEFKFVAKAWVPVNSTDKISDDWHQKLIWCLDLMIKSYH